jgi:hypothetical protein
MLDARGLAALFRLSYMLRLTLRADSECSVVLCCLKSEHALHAKNLRHRFFRLVCLARLQRCMCMYVHVHLVTCTYDGMME